MDHVIPLSLGGKTKWDNMVAACSPCNTLKGNKTRMKPKNKPYTPTYYDLVAKRKQLDMPIKHEAWRTYI